MIKRLGIYLIGSGLAACTATLSPTNESRSVEQLDSLRATYYGLTDSLTQAWQVLRQDDAQKQADLMQLLRAMRRSGYYASDTLDALAQRVEQLATFDYNLVTADNQHRVPRYDSATVRTSEAVVQYAEGYADYYADPALFFLTDKILAANRSMILYRLHYDRYSRAFNAFLDAHRDFIATLDSSALTQRQFLFQRINDRSERDSL